MFVTLFQYKKYTCDSKDWWKSYTDADGNWWASLAAFCDTNSTMLGEVDADFLVRKTNFLEQLVGRIGDPQHFIIKKAVKRVEKWTDEDDMNDVPYFPYRAIHLVLWLEYWPKGVTEHRRRECKP
jgi:hypothetical protein